MTKVSIIIPVYEVSAYVEHCLKSVMCQTYEDIECIIVDDATTDDSIKKCERLIDEYQRPMQFRILHHETNRGLSASRNTGLSVAKGDYIYYLDGDDEITPDCIEKLMVPVMEDSSIDMVQGSFQREQWDKKVDGNPDCYDIKMTSNDDIRKYYINHYNTLFYAWNKLLRRSFLETHQLLFKEGLLYEDQLWMFYMLKHLKRVSICSDRTYLYHIRPHSITMEADKKLVGESFQITYDEILHHLTDGKEQEELNLYKLGFCKRMLLHKREVPAMKNTYSLYRDLMKQNGSRKNAYLLQMVNFLSSFGASLTLLEPFILTRRLTKRVFLKA